MILAGPSPDTGQPYTEEEWELRERLRLEALKRRSRSLRSCRSRKATGNWTAQHRPARLGAPEDSPGWERIHEGSFLEAALVTQLSGDFPGPVLAVSFHRLIYSDGRWVSLEFHSPNQVGEAALKDQVNRHYLSMFTAVGAIGVLSGLTLQGSNPYAGGGTGDFQSLLAHHPGARAVYRRGDFRSRRVRQASR